MFMKKKTIILPLLVFLVGISVLMGTVYSVRKNQQKHSQSAAELNAMTYAERMKTEVMGGIGITDTLEQILISEDGKFEKFQQIAGNLMSDSIQSIQLAPDGIVTDIYPEKGNETGKIDLLNDKDRGEIARYARDHQMTVMQGPFQLKQGGYGIAVRNPVYLDQKDGQETFWGFTIVIIRVPDIFADSVKALSDFGYQYRLSKTVSPWEMSYEYVYGSGKKLTNPVSYIFDMGGNQWKLEVMPEHGWYNIYLYEILIGGTLIVLLLTGLTRTLLNLDEHRKKFKKLAVTDPLTGIYNRHGFDELVERYLKQNTEKHCVGVLLDIDDFKSVNDMYGHASGDRALQILAESMKKFFPEKAVLGRNGGDEFCIFLPDCTCGEVKEQMEQFTKQVRTFPYESEQEKFSISLGYAEYPRYAETLEQLMHCADTALYEVKLRGKQGCMEYREGLRPEIRTQLGFVLKDVSENLPGAFIIYRADHETDEILFANREMIRLAGCRTMDDLLAYTDRSFRNLILEEERDAVEQSIWQQINAGHANDYVYFHLVKADETSLPVLDHGRIVESGRYGKIFYVLLMDQKSMKWHYGEKY